VKDAPRSVHREFDNCPISMKLEESAAIDDPQETRTTEVIEGAVAAAAKQRHGIPAQPSGARGPVFGRAQEVIAVVDKLAPSVRWDVRWWTMVIKGSHSLDPTKRNANFRRASRQIFSRRLHFCF